MSRVNRPAAERVGVRLGMDQQPGRRGDEHDSKGPDQPRPHTRRSLMPNPERQKADAEIAGHHDRRGSLGVEARSKQRPGGGKVSRPRRLEEREHADDRPQNEGRRVDGVDSHPGQHVVDGREEQNRDRTNRASCAWEKAAPEGVDQHDAEDTKDDACPTNRNRRRRQDRDGRGGCVHGQCGKPQLVVAMDEQRQQAAIEIPARLSDRVGLSSQSQLVRMPRPRDAGQVGRVDDERDDGESAGRAAGLAPRSNWCRTADRRSRRVRAR